MARRPLRPGPWSRKNSAGSARPSRRENAYARWNSFRRINNELQPWVAQRRQQLLELQSQTQRALRHEKVLGSREYGFCLYPESYLKRFSAACATSQEREKMF